MMIWLLGLALAADVDIDDLAHWQSDTDAMLHGPDGCWELSGHGRTVIVLYTPSTMWSRAGESRSEVTGSFSGVLEDGVWRDTRFETDHQEGMIETEFDPSMLFGERKKKRSDSSSTATDGAQEAANFIDRLLDSIDPSTTTSYAQWNADHSAIEYVQHVPLDDSRRPKELTVRTQFPDGGRATAVDALFPRRLSLNELADDDDEIPFRVTMMDAQAHMRSQDFNGVVLPGAETLSLVVGVLGFTVGYEQRLVYKEARRCVAKEAPVVAEPMAEPTEQPQSGALALPVEAPPGEEAEP